ncbi:hypothetical protein I0C86_03680 [Plantactinospora sp. S1510]|uniref:Uncharacterized protein n=1 Tax=Plantactinospora alkalitolerans TaxID=2789879 RepID=A0ABS0GPH4_9ACTN|nr:hypothetical protein [Plantactinospora alkalitolerans]MBF9128096.1 hypothetical protein [Plantactinospora alkalitolerans]
MKRIRRTRARHRRDWRRLWRYCRCGYRWRCPDSVELVPMPYLPTVPPPRTRTTNQRTAGHLAGRRGNLPPARPERSRQTEDFRRGARSRRGERV